MPAPPCDLQEHPPSSGLSFAHEDDNDDDDDDEGDNYDDDDDDDDGDDDDSLEGYLSGWGCG